MGEDLESGWREFEVVLLLHARRPTTVAIATPASAASLAFGITELLNNYSLFFFLCFPIIVLILYNAYPNTHYFRIVN
jgi:hypothetical protein